MSSKETQQQLKDAFIALPKVLQEAITNANVQANLRKLADVHKLHLDKWTKLENEIMMALLGITDPNELAQNISSEVGLPFEQAQEIAGSVAEIVFNPIQAELKDEVGEHKSLLENIDNAVDAAQTQKTIDISKFTPAATDPAQYKPQTVKKYVENTDPYHEPIE